MVSSKVEIFSRSYQEGAKAVHWSCEGTTDFEMEECDKAERGTDVVLHLTKEDEEFAGEEKIQYLLKKYCRFLPVEIVCGMKARIYKGFCMGWSVRYKRRLSITANENAEAWYVPGFGKNGEKHVRISLCAKPQVLEDAFRRLEEMMAV